MRVRRDIGGGFVRPRSSAEPLRVGVLGSTRGSSLAPVLAAIAAGELGGARVVVVVSNVEGAGILDKATAAGIPAVVVPSKGRSRAAFDADAAAALVAHGVDVILCVGFMRIVTPALLDHFRWRVLNVHPSLLPAFAGGMDLAVHEAVLKASGSAPLGARSALPRRSPSHAACSCSEQAGVPATGCTVHFVEDAVDAGPILLQARAGLSRMHSLHRPLDYPLPTLCRNRAPSYLATRLRP